MLKFLFPLMFFFLGNFEKAPDFEFIHESGELQSLSDYEGEVVYISFWASWCRPCLSNFQKYNDLRTILQEKGVILLNVSVDKNKKDWEKALMSYSFLRGDNVHVTDLAKVMDLYELSTIPEYRILNRKMELVSLGQEDGRDVLGSFENWLKE